MLAQDPIVLKSFFLGPKIEARCSYKNVLIEKERATVHAPTTFKALTCEIKKTCLSNLHKFTIRSKTIQGR